MTRSDEDRLAAGGRSWDPVLERPFFAGRFAGKGDFNSFVGLLVGVDRPDEGVELNEERDEDVDMLGLDLDPCTLSFDEALSSSTAFSLPFLDPSAPGNGPSFVAGSRRTMNVLASFFAVNSLISCLTSSEADFANSKASPASVGARVRPTIVPPRVRYALGEMVELEMDRSRCEGRLGSVGDTPYPFAWLDVSANVVFNGVIGGDAGRVGVDDEASGRDRW